MSLVRLVRLANSPDVYEQIGPGPNGSMVLVNRTMPLRNEIAALERQVADKREELARFMGEGPDLPTVRVEIIL